MISFPNAKINLGLNIVERRPDNYHNLETIFYPISVCDSLEIKPLDRGEEVRFFQYGMPIGGEKEDNLVVKAYRLLEKRFELPPIEIHLRKNIPFGAGLGGGSSDAAFMLKMLKDLFHLDLSNDELESIASKIGADCPFFINNKTTLAKGIGDEFEPIDIDLTGYWLLLVKPEVHVSTPDAYSMVKPQKPLVPLRDIICKPIEIWRELLVNDFESSVFAKYPQLSQIKQMMYNSGAIYASMSGSGSSMFGIFDVEPPAIFLDDDSMQVFKCRL
ncbi:MAG: 4-(cytidine 5'-diphospho)-2-C-methyl-D-erythritol kinase [Bacteroidales bacterium]